MPKQIVHTILDDMDGKSLPEDTEPLVVGYDGQNYNLYLSAANKKKVDAFLAPIIEDAEKVTATRPVAAGSGGQQAELQEWLNQSQYGREEVAAWGRANGHEVADRGRIKATIIKAFKDAMENKASDGTEKAS